MFPESLTFSIAAPVNEAVDWLVMNYGDGFEAVANALLQVLVLLEHGLRAIPWWLLIALLSGLGWLASRNWKLPLGIALLLFGLGSLGLWDQGIQTLALMVIATLLAVIIGIPIGILMARSDRPPE